LTSTSPLRAEDSFGKTAMSRREDILRCIDVTIMDRSAHPALPSSYSKTFPALRAGAVVTHAAGLGGKRFVDFLEPHACVSAFVRQHGSERTPPRVEHRLGLSGLRQSGSVHVANEHCTVALGQPGAQFVQKIFPPIGHFGVNRSGPRSVTRPLSESERGFEIAVEALGIDWWQAAVTESCKLRQTQIDSKARNGAIQDRWDVRFIFIVSRMGHTDIEIPASATVFAKITRAQLITAQSKTIPQRQPASGEVDLAGAIPNRSNLERYPAQGASRTAALAPGEADFSMLSAAARIFFRDLLHGLDGQMQGALAARDTFEKGPEIVSRQEAPLALKDFDRQFVAVIEDGVDLARQTRKPRRVLVLDPQAQNANGGRSETGPTYSLTNVGAQATPENAANVQKCAMRAPLSLSGIKAGVSRAEIR
jgi:hypothetical protein